MVKSMSQLIISILSIPNDILIIFYNIGYFIFLIKKKKKKLKQDNENSLCSHTNS